VGQEPGAGAALLDRPRGRGRLLDALLAALAGVLGSHVLLDEEPRRHELQLLARVLAEGLHGLAAARAAALVFGDLVHDALAGQVLGERLASAAPLAALCGRGFVRRDEVHRREQLHAVRRLEPFDEAGDLFQSGARSGLGVEQCIRFLGGALAERDRFVGGSFPVVAADVVAFERFEDLVQVVGVGAVDVLADVEAQRLSGLLEQVGQLLDLQQRDGIRQRRVAIDRGQEQRPRGRQRWAFGSDDAMLTGRRAARGVEQHTHLGEALERLFDHGPDFGPRQAPGAAPQRRNGDGVDVVLADDAHEILEAGRDVGVARPAEPLPLGREVDDESRASQRAGWPDLHPPGTAVATLAGLFIRADHLRARLLELQCDALAHDPGAVDGVHERLGVGLQQIALRHLDHGRLLTLDTTSWA